MSTPAKQNPDRRHVATEPIFKQRFTVVRSGTQLAEGEPAPATSGDVLKDVVVVQAGEAKGHGVYLEQAFVDKIVEFGNASPTGIKARFDHPGRCETEFGWQIGTLYNFRVDGDRAIADLHLSESAKVSPHGDLHAYILAAAEEHPDKFGNSIVFDEGDRYCYSPSGERLTEDEYYAIEKRNWVADDWYVLPANLLACDVVDEPAATAGFFAKMFSQSWVKPLVGLLRLPEVEAFAKQFPKVYKGLYKALNNQQPMKKQFDVNAVTDGGASLVIVGDAIAPGNPVNVIAEDGAVSPAPAGPHLIVESSTGETGTIVVDDMGVIQEWTPTTAAAEGDYKPDDEKKKEEGEMAALRAELAETRKMYAAMEARLAGVENKQTSFANSLKGLFTRVTRVEGQPAGQGLPGLGAADARKEKKASLMDNPWNKEAEAALANL